MGLRKSSKTIPVAFALMLGSIGAIPLILLTPPFQVPDENWHFYRAYELSEFQVLSDVRNGVSGATLPASLPQLVDLSVHTADEVKYPASPAPFSQTMQHASIPLNSSMRRFVTFPGSAYYSPLPYLPQTLGIAIARLFGAGPLGLLLMGRLFNCLAALGLLGLAVYAVPFAEEIVLLIGLLPMSLYLYASVSPDAALIGCALVFSALSLAACARGNWKAWELVASCAAAAVFCSVKPVYFPMLFAAAALPQFRRGRFINVVRPQAILLAVALVATVGWMVLARSSMSLPLGGGRPSDQAHLILHHPTVLVHAIANSLRPTEIIIRSAQAIGVFGWLTLPLRPVSIYMLPLVAFVLLGVLGIRREVHIPLSRRLWFLSLTFVSGFLVLTAMYLLGSPVGGQNIIGVQGRYFIPILALAGVSAIYPRKLPSPAWAGRAVVVAIVLLQIAAMDATILRGFQVF